MKRGKVLKMCMCKKKGEEKFYIKLALVHFHPSFHFLFYQFYPPYIVLYSFMTLAMKFNGKQDKGMEVMIGFFEEEATTHLV